MHGDAFLAELPAQGDASLDNEWVALMPEWLAPRCGNHLGFQLLRIVAQSEVVIRVHWPTPHTPHATFMIPRRRLYSPAGLKHLSEGDGNFAARSSVVS